MTDPSPGPVRPAATGGVPAAREPEPPQKPAGLPVRSGPGRAVVLASVFVCAACGLVYELELVALAASLVGDAVTQSSVVLSVMVFAMGAGSLLAKRLRCRAAVGFAWVEVLLALVGGGSAMALYACFAWFGTAQVPLVTLAFVIGALTGAEMPLLMTLIQRIRAQDAGGALADLFAADYVGALVGGLAFPFLLLPALGQLTGALLTGVVNALAGAVVVLWLFRGDLRRPARRALRAGNAAVVLLLLAATAVIGPFEAAARSALYGDDIRAVRRTPAGEAVLTGGGEEPPELYVDGHLRVSGEGERRRHEALVHPALRSGPTGRVLIVGGGDGTAVREVLRHPGVERVTVLDPSGVGPLARTDPGLRRLNRGALDDPRVRLESAEAFARLRARPPRAPGYDVVLLDEPAPADAETSRHHTREFHGLVSRALAPGGRLAVHAGRTADHPRDFWTLESTLRAAGLRTSPYLLDDRRGAHGTARGFVLAARGGRPPVTSGPAGASPVPLRAVTEAELAGGRARAERQRIPGLPPASLTHPAYRG